MVIVRFNGNGPSSTPILVEVNTSDKVKQYDNHIDPLDTQF